MAVVRWTFFDPVGNQTYIFPINPSEGGTLSYKKNITYQSVAAPDGKTLAFQGRPEVPTLEFSGTLLDRNHLEQFVAWWRHQNQIRITDDLGRQFWVVLTEFAPKRVRAQQHPYKHTYTVRSIVVDWSP